LGDISRLFRPANVSADTLLVHFRSKSLSPMGQ